MAAIKFIKRTVALDGSSVSETLPASFFNSESSAHTFIIAGQRDGAAVAFTGSVSASFLNANDAVVPLTGSIVDGAAVVTLNNNCYALSGRFTLSIDVNGATVYECQSRIKRRTSSTAYDPDDEVSVAALSAEIAAMRTATAAANTAATNATAQAQAATNTANQASANAQQAIQNLNSVANDLQDKIDEVDSQMDSMQDEIDALNDGGLVLKDDVIAQNVQDWLDDHPEATTTVTDHSITLQKIAIGAIGYVMPESYGAVGDGETDDTAAVQSAINSGKIVLLDKKTYLISDTLEIPNNLCMIGHPGSRLLWEKKSAAYDKMHANGKSNIHFENIVFDSNTQDYSSHDVSIVYSQNLKIKNCSFVNSFGTALRIHGTTHFSICGCYFENITGEAGNPGECIYGQDFNNGEIIGCSCSHVGDHFLYADGVNGIYNVMISSCVLNDTGNNGLTSGGAICIYGNSYDIAISNCVFTPAGAGIQFSTQSYSTVGAHNCTVSNCTIRGGIIGVYITGKDANTPAKNITVMGCSISDTRDGVRVLYSKNIVLNGLTIENAGRRGIAADSLSDSMICDITVTGVSDTGVGVLLGSGDALEEMSNIITDNIMLYGNLSTGGQYPIYYRRGTSYIVGHIYYDEHFQNSAIFPSAYIPDTRLTATWTPTKNIELSTYDGSITNVREAKYSINGANVYIYARFTVDTPGTGYIYLDGVPNDLVNGTAFGNTIISNSGAIGQAKAVAGATNTYLIVFFTASNPVAAAGNEIEVWVTGIKK